jgi:hypothetical protein
VAEQLLDRADIVTRFQQMRRERMAQCVRRREFGDAGIAHRLAHRALERLVAQVMAAHIAAARIGRDPLGGEHVLPTPLARGHRILARERVRQPDRAISLSQISLM